MCDSNWVTNEHGVMVFRPSTCLPSFDAIQQLLSHSNEDDEYEQVSSEDANENHASSSSSGPLPSHRSPLSLIKPEPMEENIIDELSSLNKMSAGDEHYFDNSSSFASNQGQCIFDQLKSIAASSTYSVLRSASRLKTPVSFTSDSAASNSDLDSDSDSYPEASPCPVRRESEALPSPGYRSRFFRNNKVKKRRNKITRPDWIRIPRSGNKTLGTSRSAITENMRSLEYLENLKPKSHKWNTDDRVVLLSLRRWYILTKSEFKNLFNSLQGLNMKYETLHSQFASGGPPFNEVRCPFYSIPFDDPQNVYEEIRSHIESRAAELGIVIRRRRFPEIGKYGKYEDEGRQSPLWLSNDMEPPSKINTQSSQFAARNYRTSKLLGGRAIPDGDCNSLDELVDSEVSTVSTVSSPGDSPHLAFRCWDHNNWTAYDEDNGFTAAAFKWVGGPLEEDPPSNCTKLMMALARPHLSVEGGIESCFISLFTSLLQMMAFSAKKTDPTICIVDLDHPALAVPGKKQAAQPIVKELKAHGEMAWARYQAINEYLIYGQLPKSAILHKIQLGELQQLAAEDPHVSRLLNLDLFTERSSTRTVSKRLRKERLVLNPETARAMGKVARFFGLGGPTVTTLHISDFVTCLTDGWSIRAYPRYDNGDNEINVIAIHFGLALSPSTSQARLHDIQDAFLLGFKRGTYNLAKYAPRRRTA